MEGCKWRMAESSGTERGEEREEGTASTQQGAIFTMATIAGPFSCCCNNSALTRHSLLLQTVCVHMRNHTHKDTSLQPLIWLHVSVSIRVTYWILMILHCHKPHNLSVCSPFWLSLIVFIYTAVTGHFQYAVLISLPLLWQSWFYHKAICHLSDGDWKARTLAIWLQPHTISQVIK